MIKRKKNPNEYIYVSKKIIYKYILFKFMIIKNKK